MDKDIIIGLFGWRQQPGLAEKVGQLLESGPFRLRHLNDDHQPESGAADALIFLNPEGLGQERPWAALWPVLLLADSLALVKTQVSAHGGSLCYLPVDSQDDWQSQLVPLLSQVTALENTAMRMRLLPPADRDWWLLFDRQGKVSWAGEAWEMELDAQSTGTLPPVWEVLNMEQQYWSMCWRAVQSGASVSVNAHPIARSGGALVYLDWELLPGDQAGFGAVAALLRARDVSERVAAAEAYERLEKERNLLQNDMERFVEAASHDLKEPLRNVSNFVQLLRHRYGDKVGSEGADYIAYAVSGVRRMWDLMDELLLFANLTAAREHYRWLLPADLLADTMIQLEQPGLLTVHQLPEKIYGHPAQLALLFRHLLDNGYRYNPSENRLVGVEGLEERSHWIISFWDNGPGIAPEFQQRAFSLFKRLHGQEDAPGRGMGLSVCRKIADLHGGHIHLASEPDRGTALHVWLPKPAGAGKGAG